MLKPMAENPTRARLGGVYVAYKLDCSFLT